MISIEAHTKNTQNVLNQIRAKVFQIDENARNFLNDSAIHYTGMLMRNIGLTCHTIGDLAKMGHPYSKRNPRPVHGTQIHKQTGAMQRSWNNSYPYKSKYPASIIGQNRLVYERAMTFDEAKNSEGYAHAVWTIMGTTKMIQRFVVKATLKDFEDPYGRIFNKWFTGSGWSKMSRLGRRI